LIVLVLSSAFALLATELILDTGFSDVNTLQV